jgi:hypothetical protein
MFNPALPRRAHFTDEAADNGILQKKEVAMKSRKSDYLFTPRQKSPAVEATECFPGSKYTGGNTYKKGQNKKYFRDVLEGSY